MTITRVLVVGGGIAGLATAIGLRQRSAGAAAVDVAEVSEDPFGAAMGIANRAADALRELGVYDELALVGDPADMSMLQVKGPDGSCAPLPPGLAAEAGPFDPSEPFGLILYRPDLASVLAGAARRAGAVLLPIGHTVQALANGPSGVTVTFTDGAQQHYDLVVGADGIRSSVRHLVFGDRYQPQFVGEISVRAIVDGTGLAIERGPHIAPTGTLFFARPRAGLGYINCTFPTQDKQVLDQKQARAWLDKVFDGFTDPSVAALRDRIGPEVDVVCKAFESVWIDEPWYRDRVVIIGDAAHATSAHLGSGGAMALEDGVVLAAELTGDGTVHDRLDRFYRRRRDRTEMVVKTSLQLLEIEASGQWASPESAMLSLDAFMRLAQPY